ncbi:MAG: ABC transporter substrate-binding protein [Burkholderiales bacterium]|nr:ABC transporter substrate-binding protein [Burkholderiales bacterium]
MRKSIAKCLVSLALALAAPASHAQDLAPAALLRSVSDEVIQKLKQDRILQAADPARVEDLLHSSVLPLFDFAHMTRLAVARNWHLATPVQQDLITEEFRTLLVRTYSTALENYRGEPVVYKQLRPGPKGANVTVRSEVGQPGGERTTLDYEMENTAAGWRIYNVKVADLSLVGAYREVFAEKVREGGVEGLIVFLADKNRGGESRFNTIKASFWEKSRLVYAIMQKVLRSGLQ